MQNVTVLLLMPGILRGSILSQNSPSVDANARDTQEVPTFLKIH
jgi:hypothetical protein